VGTLKFLFQGERNKMIVNDSGEKFTAKEAAKKICRAYFEHGEETHEGGDGSTPVGWRDFERLTEREEDLIRSQLILLQRRISKILE
jgi:hypothetical protein